MNVLRSLNNFCYPVSPFWESAVEETSVHSCNTTRHETVDFTICFEDTVFLCGICTTFSLAAGLRLLLGNHKGSPVPFNRLNAIKTLAIAVPLVTSLCDLFFSIAQRSNGSTATFQYMSPVILGFASFLAGVITYHKRRVGVHSSGLLHLFWLAMVVYGVIKLRTLILTAQEAHGVRDAFRFTTFCLQFVSYLVEFVLVLIPEPLPVPEFREEERKSCPEKRASFLSQLTWWWMNGLIWRGWRKALEDSDLTDLNEEDKSQTVTAQFDNNWQCGPQKTNYGKERTFHFETIEDSSSSDILLLEHSQSSRAGEEEDQGTRRHSKNQSLVLALAKTFKRMLLRSFVFKLCNDLLAFVSPLILKAMINYTSDATQPQWKGYLYAVMLFVVAAVQSLCLHQYFQSCITVGMRIRTTLIGAVYRKAMKLSSNARKARTVGEIVNLMSVDSQKCMELMTYVNLVWSAPLQILIALIMLWFTMGPSIFAGVGVMILLIPVNTCVAALTEKLQTKQMTYKDSRTKLVNEILNGIKVIKLYAWEIPFQRIIMAVRGQELGVLRNSAYLTAASSITWTSAPFLVALVTFATYALVHQGSLTERLTSERIFVSLSLFNLISFPLSMLPVVISNVVQARVSARRISSFLKDEELDPNDVIRVDVPPSNGDEDAVTMVGATFTWDSPERPVLSDLNLHIKPGQLVAVVGQVGAGKSSLISALLGEVEKVEGNCQPQGRYVQNCATVSFREEDCFLQGQLAYIPQQAWIQNASVKDNILFGQPMNGILYGNTLSACALEPDLDILPAGDATEIGEKGINLSGGQKQRVSLARAVYQQADIYLLDDPLSAVDSHVGKHIFEKVIGPEGMLQGKVRVLVTHGLTFLPQCDLIVVLVDGRISEIGTYSELLNNKGAFSEFIETYATTEEEEVRFDQNIVRFDRDIVRFDRDIVRFDQDIVRFDQDIVKLDQDYRIASIVEGPSKGREELTSLPSGGKESEAKSTAIPDKALISAEQAQVGNVKWLVLLTYFKAISLWLVALVFFLYVLGGVFSVLATFQLSDWSNAEAQPNASTNPASYLGPYTGLGVAQTVLSFLATFSLVVAEIRASRVLHNTMLERLLRAPMHFFDTTPLGRILNRFSKDVYTVDIEIPTTSDQFLMMLTEVFSIIVAILIAIPVFGLVVVPLGVFYFLIQRFYVSTSRQLQRLESISRSPIYSHFQESIQGATSIRAYRVQERFVLENERRVDHNLMAYFLSVSSNRWLAIRLEFVGNLVIFFTALFAVIQINYRSQLETHINSGLVGLAISYALQITQCLGWLVRMTSQLESNIVAVERISEYSEVETEAPAIIASHRPPDGWPTAGEVRFERYSTRYREGMDLVLRDISVTVPGGTKIGIVGRTGAGKTSMTLALFRIIEAVEGFIQIDGINIADIGLQDLRSRITIIPQDPVLFSGTLRLNLDPFNTYSDDDLWRVLEIAHLKDFVSTLAEGLAYPVSEGGENLSVGQRQLVCLARALLRKTKILVLDEATAAVDMETDDLIQKTIRSEFASCTVFTIAHRLNTILDYDYVLVLGAGQVLEYASPTELLANSSSVFYSMAKDAGLV
ncbi:hypothetical protein EMCRGX_G028343 [Ephydatia muelleri]